MNKKTDEEKTSNKSIFKCKSQEMGESNNSIIIGSMQPTHKMWKSKEFKEENPRSNIMRVSRNKTS